MAKGRPFLEGVVRYACGQINKAETAKALAAAAKHAPDDSGAPSAKVKTARDLFSVKCFKGGGLGNHAGDAIGQLWLLGHLDIPGFDDTRLLSAARCWWHGREITFKDIGHKTAKYERASRTSNSSDRLSRPERDYQRYSSFLLDASDYESDCLESLMETTIDGDFPSWVSRIVQTGLLKHFRFPVAELACDRDHDKLEAAKRALVAMAGPAKGRARDR
jgi:hypothetical protein